LLEDCSGLDIDDARVVDTVSIEKGRHACGVELGSSSVPSGIHEPEREIDIWQRINGTDIRTGPGVTRLTGGLNDLAAVVCQAVALRTGSVRVAGIDRDWRAILCIRFERIGR
jgi:hypothetical protein